MAEEDLELGFTVKNKSALQETVSMLDLAGKKYNQIKEAGEKLKKLNLGGVYGVAAGNAINAARSVGEKIIGGESVADTIINTSKELTNQGLYAVGGFVGGAIGSAILPGIGTAVGSIVGGAAASFAGESVGGTFDNLRELYNLKNPPISEVQSEESFREIENKKRDDFDKAFLALMRD